MKKILLFVLFAFSTNAVSELCTYTIRDNYGYEYQRFTRISYSYYAACSDAQWDCMRALSDAQSVGRYYNAVCLEEYTTPNYPTPYPYPPQYPREPQYPRDPREPRYPREPHYPREPREPRDPRYPRDPRGPEPRGPRHDR